MQLRYNLHGASKSFRRILRAQLIQYRNYWSEKSLEQTCIKNEEHVVLSVDFFCNCCGFPDNLKRITSRHSKDRRSIVIYSCDKCQHDALFWVNDKLDTQLRYIKRLLL